MKDPKRVARGKKAKASGADFELRVRKDLTEKGWIVDKWGNNVEFTDVSILDADIMSESEFNLRRSLHNKTAQTESDLNYLSKDVKYISEKKIEGKLIQAKNKWAGPNRPMMMSAGFPDFVCFKNLKCKMAGYNSIHEVVGVEVKTNGYLDKLEREKCRWYLKENIFSKIIIAEKTKVKNRVVIVYHDFEEKYGKNT